ncbi:MAG: J domain-containing protein [Firmicutes bacterium]|nr:J domain-containing protein [Bacillota bacterium]
MEKFSRMSDEFGFDGMKEPQKFSSLNPEFGFGEEGMRKKRGKVIYFPSPLDRCFMILGLTPDATKNEVKIAFKQKAITYHPDRNPDNVEWAQAEFTKCNDAYMKIKEHMIAAEKEAEIQSTPETEMTDVA